MLSQPVKGPARRWDRGFVVAAMLLPALLFGVVAWQDHGLVLREAERKVQDTTSIFEEHARNIFETHSLIASRVDEYIRGMSWREISGSLTVHQYLSNLAEEFPQVRSLWLADREGTVRGSSLYYPPPPISVTGRDYFEALSQRDQGIFIGSLVRARIGTADVFNVALRRYAGSGTFDGVIIVSALPSYFTGFWQRTVPQAHLSAALIRQDGAYLARLPPLTEQDPPPLAPDDELRLAIARSNEGTFRRGAGTPGGEELVAYNRVANFPVYVVHSLSRHAALQPWRDHLVQYGIFFGIGTLGLVSLAHVAGRRSRSAAKAHSLADRFRSMIDAAPDPLLVIRLDGRIGFTNGRALETFGYEREDMAEQTVETLIAGRRRNRLLASLALYVARAPGRRILGSRAVIALRKDGTRFPADVSLSPVEIDGEEFVMALVRDVTQRKQLEADIEASRAKVASSERLAALGVMAGGVAHEVNNPLMVIHAMASDLADRAEEGDTDPSEVLHAARQIELFANRITQIIKSMLHLARDGARDPFLDTPVAQIVEHALDLCRLRFRAQAVELIVAPIDPDLVVTCRDVQISQILVNLLQNALDAALEEPGDRWVRLEAKVEDGRVNISVIDSGPGIAPDLRARVLEPFFTTKPVGQGTGLGLSLSRQIAEEHGGSLDLGEKEGHTCVMLSLRMASQGDVRR